MNELINTKRNQVEHAYENSADAIVFQVEDKIYICFGGYEIFDNTTIMFKECQEPQFYDGIEYDGDLKPQVVDVYCLHRYNREDIYDTVYSKSDHIETIIQR